MNDYQRLSGLDSLFQIALLPFLNKSTRIHYEGSIDKSGGNADWDWWLYQDHQNEWVLLDIEGPGCLFNFVQHRYPTSEEPIFRFYFDHESEPRFTIRHSEFGEKYPFVEPLASRYVGPPDNGRGPIRVCRSFVPMPFRDGCRITSSVQLKGYAKDQGDGGWGHVMYQSYATDLNLPVFTINDQYNSLIRLWKNIGSDPKKTPDLAAADLCDLELVPGESRIIWQDAGAGALTALQMRLADADANSGIENIWIRMYWDNHEQPDIDLPLNCLFANELGCNKTYYLMSGYQPGGLCYNYFPMPYWLSASVELSNRGINPVRIPWIGLRKMQDTTFYPRASCAYFRAAPYYTRKATPGSDSVLADIHGQGHVVSALITSHGSRPNEVTCEGDVRVYIDDSATPQVESDGSESFSCYGWGFPTPPETNPCSGYDGLPNSPWSMNRHCLGDRMPFSLHLRFGIESGGCNDQYLEHSGAIFYYGLDQCSSELTDVLDIDNPESVRNHHYQADGAFVRASLKAAYEGDDDHILIADEGIYQAESSCFTVKVNPDNQGVRLRRRSDQEHGRQRAAVWVNGQRVTERPWYYADRNPIKRWLDDEFDIPARYTAGQTALTIKIVPESIDGLKSWNEFHYWVYSLL